MSNQLNLFTSESLLSNRSEVQHLELRDGAVIEFIEHFYPEDEASAYFDRLLNEVEWQQDYIRLYGRQNVPLPRLTAWYGDKGSTYNYSGIGMDPKPWTPLLLKLRQSAQDASSQIFNSVLLNLYRHGQDGVAWHRDNEKELGPEPVIASLSFGTARRFQFRHKSDRLEPKFELLLSSGSLLIMRGKTQQFWEHQIPKTAKPTGSRINLTFRFIGEK